MIFDVRPTDRLIIGSTHTCAHNHFNVSVDSVFSPIDDDLDSGGNDLSAHSRQTYFCYQSVGLNEQIVWVSVRNGSRL